MPRTIPIQTSFAGGEISPKLRGRVDTELWKKGLDECINFEPLAHGPLLSRGGTKWNRIFANLTSECRAIEFPRQGEVGFLMVLGGGALSVRDGVTGEQAEAGAIDWTLNPTFRAGWQSWERGFGATANPLAGSVAAGRYLIMWNPIAYPRVDQVVTALPAGTYTFQVGYSTPAGGACRAAIGTAAGLGDIVDQALGDTGGLSSYAAVPISFTIAAPTTVYVRVQPSFGGARETVGEYDASLELKEIAIRSAGTGDALWDGTTTPVLPWTSAQLEALHVVSEPARDRVMFFHPGVAPYELIFARDTGAWTFQAIGFTFDPAGDAWVAPNFPATAELYQGRLIVGGIPGKENTIVASQSGDPYDFTTGSDRNDGFSLDVSTKGSIRWLQGHRTLLLGTDREEHIVTAQGGTLTPTDFEIRPQSGFGSATVQALHLGDLAMYVSRDRRRLRMLSYSDQDGGWQTRDLTFTSEHLTGGLIRDIDWLSTGNDQVFAVMRSGEVAGWTFNRAEQVIAPWRVDFGGAVHALCVLDIGDQDKVWMLVQRPGGVCLEEWHVADDPERCLLDSYCAVRPSAGRAGGLTWLVGETVVAICDGVALDPQVVSAAGEITVPVNATTCVAGIYSPRSFKTLPREDGQPGGSAAGSKQRFTKFSLRLNDSALPLVNEDRVAPDRSPETSMGEVEPRFTGDVPSRVLGWESKGAVVVSQDKPIRTEILAIFGVLSSNEV